MTTLPRFVFNNRLNEAVVLELMLEGTPDGLAVRTNGTTFRPRPVVEVTRATPANINKIREAERAVELGLHVEVPAAEFPADEEDVLLTREEFEEQSQQALASLPSGKSSPTAPTGTVWKKGEGRFPALLGKGAEGQTFEAHFCSGGHDRDLNGLLADEPGLFGQISPALAAQLRLLAQVNELRQEACLARLEAEKKAKETAERAALAAKFGVPNPDGE